MNVMIDLETMDDGPNAAIVAIGAVGFDIPTGTITSKFYRSVSLKSSMLNGGEVSAETIMWWLTQSGEARNAISINLITINQALIDFSQWLDDGNPLIWGNPAMFDNVVLTQAYLNCYQGRPWSRKNDRCYRTIKKTRPDIKMVRIGIHHNALDDAESQAVHLMAILNDGV